MHCKVVLHALISSRSAMCGTAQHIAVVRRDQHLQQWRPLIGRSSACPQSTVRQFDIDSSAVHEAFEVA